MKLVKSKANSKKSFKAGMSERIQSFRHFDCELLGGSGGLVTLLFIFL